MGPAGSPATKRQAVGAVSRVIRAGGRSRGRTEVPNDGSRGRPKPNGTAPERQIAHACGGSLDIPAVVTCASEGGAKTA